MQYVVTIDLLVSADTPEQASALVETTIDLECRSLPGINGYRAPTVREALSHRNHEV
jgi:hypothetical protein